MKAGAKRKREGFTLVEVIISIAILSLIMLATTSGLRTLGNTAGTIQKMTDRVDEIRSVSAFLRDALENSVVGSRSSSPGGISFGGNSLNSEPTTFFRIIGDELEWRSKVLFGEAYGGNYFLRLARDGDRLILQWQEPGDNVEPGRWFNSPTREVLRDVALFEVWHRPELSAAWTRQNFEELDKQPSHVKLVIKAEDRFWPELIMTVQR